MITAIIVDDESKSISTLQKFLADFCPHIHIVGTAGNIAKAKLLIENLNPQLVFLDIEMPLGNGFDLLQSLKSITFEVIFITAFNHYAINAFRFAAIDYLLKPVNISQLQEAVARATQRIEEKIASQNYTLLLQNLNEEMANEQQIVLHDMEGQHIFKLKEILYCIAEGSYTAFHLQHGKVFISSKNLKEYETLLPESDFCRIHHGHIVNKIHIQQVGRGRGGSVKMRDGQELEISVRKKETFLEWFKR